MRRERYLYSPKMTLEREKFCLYCNVQEISLPTDLKRDTISSFQDCLQCKLPWKDTVSAFWSESPYNNTKNAWRIAPSVNQIIKKHKFSVREFAFQSIIYPFYPHSSHATIIIEYILHSRYFRHFECKKCLCLKKSRLYLVVEIVNKLLEYMNKGYFVYAHTCRILKSVTKMIFKEERNEKERLKVRTSLTRQF